MKKNILFLIVVFMFVGCATNNPNIPKEKISSKFFLNKIEFHFSQTVTPKIKYQSAEELEQRVVNKITTLLEEKKLIENNPNLDILDINITYVRRFVGDKSFVKSSRLRSPLMSYDIIIKNHNKVLRHVYEKKLVHKGGLFSNFKTMFGGNKTDKYENNIADSLCQKIVTNIENIK